MKNFIILSIALISLLFTSCDKLDNRYMFILKQNTEFVPWTTESTKEFIDNSEEYDLFQHSYWWDFSYKIRSDKAFDTIYMNALLKEFFEENYYEYFTNEDSSTKAYKDECIEVDNLKLSLGSYYNLYVDDNTVVDNKSVTIELEIGMVVLSKQIDNEEVYSKLADKFNAYFTEKINLVKHLDMYLNNKYNN